jgi:TRAP-type mannitol/chloroaromatic compound transport system substrate-binding protein
VPALEVLPNVESGIYPIGHTASYYYTDRAEFTAFGTSLPFGLTVRQQNAWLYEAGGLDQLQLLYRDRFGMIQFPAGATGAQMGGWFNREIRSMATSRGLKMRIPGLGGRVMERLGVAVQQVPGDEILEALRTGAVDAVEWVGPYDDLNLDLPSVARYYYYPGFWEPGPTIEVEVNARAVRRHSAAPSACHSGGRHQVGRDDDGALRTSATPRPWSPSNATPDVEILPYPDDVLLAGRDVSFALYGELAARGRRLQSAVQAVERPFVRRPPGGSPSPRRR